MIAKLALKKEIKRKSPVNKEKIITELKKEINKYKIPLDFFNFDSLKINDDTVRVSLNIKAINQYADNHNFYSNTDIIKILKGLFDEIDGYKIKLIYNKKKSSVKDDTNFHIDMLDASLDKMKDPVLKSSVVDAVVAYWVGKKIVSDIKGLMNEGIISKSKNDVYYVV